MNYKTEIKKNTKTEKSTQSVCMSRGFRLVQAITSEPLKVEEWFSKQRLEKHKFAKMLVG